MSGLYDNLGKVITQLTTQLQQLQAKVQENERQISDYRQIIQRNQANDAALSFVPGSGNIVTSKPKLCVVTSVTGDLATCSPIVDDPNNGLPENLTVDSDNNIENVWIKDVEVNNVALVFFVGIHANTPTAPYLRRFVGVPVAVGGSISLAKITQIDTTTFDANPVKSDGTVDDQTTLTVETFLFNSTTLSEAFPLLVAGNEVPVFQYGDTWYCTFGFQGFVTCS